MGGSAPRAASARRRLGRSGVWVTALSLGTAPLGNLFGAVTDRQAAAVLDAAFEVGIGYLDTAPHYGVGLAEERLGRALAGRDRAAFTLSTKVGRLLRPLRDGEQPDAQGFVDTPPRAREWDFSAAGIRASLEASLERLGLDRIDVALLHDPDNHEREVYEAGYAALAALRAQGVVGAIGAGMNQSAMPTRFVRDFDLDVVLCAGRYTLLDQSALADLLPECGRRGTSVVFGGVFNSGLLANPRPGATFDYVTAPEQLVRKAQTIAAVCARHGVPLKAAALQFPLRQPAAASVLVGCRSEAEVRENAALFAHPIPDLLWAELAESGLVAPEAVRLGGY
ncbi:aldo/keto reductase [Actinocrinis puniceicyclus]|uniref:Aldo/keto reductase n=1 Tax=Actinocrinis puniceicyclus TaxID=977794 RepID=A0A8J7WQ90_9ACTN|nr:aldo/keto reductase [Actinocrinis puniceicyclus]